MDAEDRHSPTQKEPQKNTPYRTLMQTNLSFSSCWVCNNFNTQTTEKTHGAYPQHTR